MDRRAVIAKLLPPDLPSAQAAAYEAAILQIVEAAWLTSSHAPAPPTERPTLHGEGGVWAVRYLEAVAKAREAGDLIGRWPWTKELAAAFDAAKDDTWREAAIARVAGARRNPARLALVILREGPRPPRAKAPAPQTSRTPTDRRRVDPMSEWMARRKTE